MRNVLGIALIGLLLPLVIGCKRPLGSTDTGKPVRFVSYNEKMQEMERARRKTAGLKTTTTMTLDSAGNLFAANIDSFNRDGRLVASRSFNGVGVPYKEIIHTYADSLLMETKKVESGHTVQVAYRYDAKGRRLEEAIFEGTPDTSMRRTFRYDEVGNEVEAQFYRRANNSRLRKVTEFDSVGRPILVTEFEGDKPNWTESYVYKGNIWETVRKKGDGSVLSLYHMQYDDKGMCVELVNKDAEGKVRMKVRFTYDDEGRLLEEKVLGTTGAAVQTTTYTYDDRGILLARKFSSTQMPQGMEFRYENIYYE